MKINVLPRSAFMKIKGTEEEMKTLDCYRIISIQNTNSDNTEPPFSKENLTHPHLLCLSFDDIVNEPLCSEDAYQGRLFSPQDACAILEFVREDGLPLLVHCSAGISRSGAVGDALNEYFNHILHCNSEDYAYFHENNRQIMPNSLVHRIMMRAISARINNDNGQF